MTIARIDTRKAFFDVLDQTRADADALVQKVNGFPPYQSILAQLDAMKAMTANGRTPTEDERDSISIGLIAVRELEPVDDEQMADFVHRLHELNGYFREWPPT